MQLYYYNAPQKNFGDELNSWLWSELLPGFFDEDPSVWVSVIGTIINNKMPDAKQKIVFSSGAGYEPPPEDLGRPCWNIICVRGPLTARVLNLPENMAITDGSILLASLPGYKALPERERSGVIFMPHHRALDYGIWDEVCKRANIQFVSPREDSKIIIQKLRNAKLVLADALHAAIVADTLRVPWVPVIASSSINGFKWFDWSLSLGIAYKPLKLSSSTMAEMWTRKILNSFGGIHVQGDTPDEVCQAYKDKFSHKHDSRAYFFKKARLGTAKSLRYCSKMLDGLYIGSVYNNLLIDKAANELGKAASQTQYLSSDQLFKIRLSQMCDKLEILKKLKI